jgi:hypothetical protein
VVKGVKLVMCIAHDEDTCHYMSGEFGGMASTRVEAKLCPSQRPSYNRYFVKIDDL